MTTNKLILRTCTEIATDDSASVKNAGQQPLSEFRELPAYVLLGEPGAGKTTEFEQECSALGNQAEQISARRFAKADIAAKTEWRDKVLFIDGLDETRAGGREATEALDEIAARLEQLGPPRFRISCRAADWLGPVDRHPLAEVSPDGRVTTLRLEPLKRSDVHQHLTDQLPGADPAAFIREAESRGLGPMLDNPLTLQLLITTTNSGGWPSTRREAFEGCCRRLAQEFRSTHPRSAQTHPPESTLAAAGRLCAIQLLTGADGFMLAPATTDTGFVPAAEVAEDIAKALAQPEFDVRDVFATSLFAPAGEQCRAPKHRQIAEYLAAAHIADLIETGRTSVGRVRIALTSRIDDRIVTDLRGLAAWLGSLSGEARREMIASDPVGMGLYGDISEWRVDDRRTLLEGLIAQAQPEDLRGIRWFDKNEHLYRDWMAWGFRSLCKPDMVDTLEEYLGSAHRDAVPSHILEFLLRSLTEIEDCWRDQLHNLVPHVGELAREVTTQPEVRLAALLAFARIERRESEVAATLRDALAAVRDGRFVDPDDEIAGTLLRLLYPNVIAPDRIWEYASLMHRGPAGLENWNFWREVLCDATPADELANLLDGFADDAERLLPVIASAFAEEVPRRLLVRALREIGHQTEPDRLYRWIAAVKSGQLTTNTDQNAGLREWYRDNGATTRQLLKIAIARSSDNSVGMDERYLLDELLRCTRPPKFVEWCAQQAREHAAIDWGAACAFLEAAVRYGRWLGINDGLWTERLRSALATDPQLLGHLDEYLTPSATQLEAQVEERRYQQELDEIRAEHEQEKQQRQSDWQALLRESRDELTTSCFPATNLHTLAMAYLGRLVQRADLYDPRDRVAELIGDNAELRDAALEALRNAPLRDDVPSAERTAELNAESKHDWLAYPVLAGLDIREADGTLDSSHLPDDLRRSAVAIYTTTLLDRQQRPMWPVRLLYEDPTLVLDVLHRCAVAAIKNGETHLWMLEWLDKIDGLDDELRDFRLRLLGSISVRLPVAQLPAMDRLLLLVSMHPDATPFGELVIQKLQTKSMTGAQRVRWMTLDAIMSGGDALRSLDDFIGSNAKRAQQLAESFSRGFHHPGKFVDRLLGDDRCTKLQTLLSIFGRHLSPRERRNGEAVTIGPSEKMAYLAQRWINDLGEQPTEEAGAALDALIADERLRAWHSRLEYARNQQRRLHRDASYAPMNVADVLGLLRNGPPANVADLHVLLYERLRDLGSHIRGDNDDLWGPFWADDHKSQPSEPKYENSCRNALLTMLRSRLPEGVDAQREGQYAADRRADIRVGFKDCNVPIEIKRNNHSDLWTAIDDQLTAKYTTDPVTGGYGIYLVLWLGADAPGYPRHPTTHDRPEAPDELERRLNESMSHEQRRTISVVVLDVTKP